MKSTMLETKNDESHIDVSSSSSSSTISTSSTLQVIVVTEVLDRPTEEIRIFEKTSEKIVIKPSCFDPVPEPDLSRIPLPLPREKMSQTDRRKFQCLASYRSMKKKSPIIDFVQNPFQGDINNSETVVLVLDQLFPRRLGFNQSQYKYDDSDYRNTEEYADLGSLHLALSPDNQIKKALFQLQLNMKYDVINQTAETIKSFVFEFIRAIAKLINCDPKFIRVFAIENDTARGNNININLGITAQSENRTIYLVEDLMQKVASKAVLEQQKDDILLHVIPKQYEYKLEPVLVHLQLQKSDFDSNHNLDYPANHPVACRRGGRPYYFPRSWFRHALKVDDKYSGDTKWLGNQHEPNAWPVAYHGTCDFAVKDIVHEGFSHEKVTADFYKQEAIDMKGRDADVKGIYLATHCEGGASKYARTFTVKTDAGEEKKYKMVLQCRVHPNKYTEHTGPGVDVGKILRVFDEKAIRPYGILLKEEKEPDGILLKVAKAPVTFCALS